MICPHGHLSQSEDFCDTCGAKIDPSAQPAPSTPAPPDRVPSGAGPTAASGGEAPTNESGQRCPNCQTVNLPDALFCEACGYDFTTGALPRGAATPAPAAPTEVVAPVTNPAGPQWVAEVWVDPDWYAGQEADEPLPSPGLPTVVALGRSNLVGRVSGSRNTHPDVDCTNDTGVSRRHAQLTSDGTRWFVEDLGSSNGTFVGPASGPLPVEPIAVGPRTELDGDDRVYVGAWTRIVVRLATEDEQAAG